MLSVRFRRQVERHERSLLESCKRAAPAITAQRRRLELRLGGGRRRRWCFLPLPTRTLDARRHRSLCKAAAATSARFARHGTARRTRAVERGTRTDCSESCGCSIAAVGAGMVMMAPARVAPRQTPIQAMRLATSSGGGQARCHRHRLLLSDRDTLGVEAAQDVARPPPLELLRDLLRVLALPLLDLLLARLALPRHGGRQRGERRKGWHRALKSPSSAHRA